MSRTETAQSDEVHLGLVTECSQLFEPLRHASVGDALANTVGVALEAGVAAARYRDSDTAPRL